MAIDLVTVTTGLQTSNATEWVNYNDVELPPEDQTWGGLMVVIARNASGTSRMWLAGALFEQIVNMVSPVGDAGGAAWGVRVAFDGDHLTVQCRGGSEQDPVSWYIESDLWGVLSPV